MAFELQGKILELYDTAEVSDKFKKREFVIEKTEANGDRSFTDFVKFQTTQDKTNLLSNFKKGDNVKVSFNIRGTKWEKDGRTSYFVNLDVWRIEKVGDASEETTDTMIEYNQPDPVPGADTVVDDLPF